MNNRVLAMSQTTFDHIVSKSTVAERQRLLDQKESGSLVINDHLEDYKFFNLKKSDIAEVVQK